jgi:dynein heavy chain
MPRVAGSFDLATGEWTDGIGAVLIRHISQPNTEETGVTQDNIKWMVFDGPVDAIWIENMNTVLDDNKKLCLTSGEIIPLSETNRIMFEVEDLAVASPATVSRCGMIYVEPQYLLPDRMKPTEASKTPLFTSWLEQLKSPIDAHRETLRALIDEYIVPCTELLRLELKQPVPAVMPNTVAGVMRLLDALFIPYLPEEGAEPDPEKEKAIKEALPTYITPLFFSALIWAVGGTCEPESRAKFDTFLRGKIKEKGTKVSIPTDATVYDFVYDPPTNTWRRWASIIDPFSISDKTNFQADYNSLIVPTAASICCSLLRCTRSSSARQARQRVWSSTTS